MRLDQLQFEDNSATRELPTEQSVAAKPSLSGYIFSHTRRYPRLEQPRIVCLSSAFQLIDVDAAYEDDAESTEDDLNSTAHRLTGAAALPGGPEMPYAHCYAGYQFGFFSGQLGDGAAMSLGEVLNTEGKRWELQVKGCGPTPFSRNAPLATLALQRALLYRGTPTA